MSESNVYVRVNHRELRKVKRDKNPDMYAFLENNIQLMLEKLNEDFKKVAEKQAKAIENNEVPERVTITCPVMYVSRKEWDLLAVGFGQKEVYAMTLCFASNKLLCDIRINHEDRIKEKIKGHKESVVKVKSVNQINEMLADFNKHEIEKLASKPKKGTIIQFPEHKAFSKN